MTISQPVAVAVTDATGVLGCYTTHDLADRGADQRLLRPRRSARRSDRIVHGFCIRERRTTRPASRVRRPVTPRRRTFGLTGFGAPNLQLDAWAGPYWVHL